MVELTDLRPGSVLAGYTIVRLLGRGGMGAVYLAKHPRLPREDALKVLRADIGGDPSFRARFEREANLAAQLNHPNIVTVHDCGLESGIMWLTMQCVEGSDAASLLRGHPNGLPPEQVVDIITQAARGIDAAHQKGLLHRDIKPANLLVTPGWNGQPDSERVLVSDFGIAKTIDGDAGLTQTGAFIASLDYAAPEIFGGGVVDHRADIYSLGCTLFELLTGTRPYPYTNPPALMRGHLMEPPPRPTAIRAGLNPAIDDVVAMAMAKEPSARFANCRALANAAATALAAPPVRHTTQTRTPPPAQTWTPPSAMPSHSPPSRSGRRAAVAAVAVGAIALLGIGTVVALNLLNDDDTGSTTTTLVASPSTATASSSLTGTWQGTVSGDQTGYNVEAQIRDSDPLTATVNYPQLQCTGTWTERTPARDGVRFVSETISSGNCVPTEITLAPQPDGTLFYTGTFWSESQNKMLTINAELRRS